MIMECKNNNREGHDLPPLLLPKQLQEYKYKEQQRIITAAGISAVLAGRKDT